MKKKLIIAIIAVFVLLGGGIGGYVYHSNQVKDEKMANYKKALSDYRFNSNRLIYSLDFVATDFVINWNSAIMNKKAMNAKNEIVPCSDFEDAVSSRYAFYDKYGAYKILDSVYVSLGKHLEKMRVNSNEDQQKIVESCSDEYKELNNAIVLVKKPYGALVQYSKQKGDLFFKLYAFDSELAKVSPLEEDKGDERTKAMNMELYGTHLFVTADFDKEPQKAKKQSYTFSNISTNWIYLK